MAHSHVVASALPSYVSRARTAAMNVSWVTSSASATSPPQRTSTYPYTRTTAWSYQPWKAAASEKTRERAAFRSAAVASGRSTELRLHRDAPHDVVPWRREPQRVAHDQDRPQLLAGSCPHA